MNSPIGGGRGQSPKSNKRSTTIYGAPSVGRRSRVASAANSQEMKLKHLETKLHSMTNEVNVKLNDIYKLVDQLVVSYQEEDVFPIAPSSTPIKDKPMKDIHGRKYSTTSNMTSETVETACDSEVRDDQTKRPQLQSIATLGTGSSPQSEVLASSASKNLEFIASSIF